MKVFSFKCLVIALLAVNVSLLAQGQTQPSPNSQAQVDSEKGITWFESFQGTINSDSRIYKIDSNLGWDFNKRFGVFVGVPVYFANVPSSTTSNGTTTTTNASYTNSGIGNAYLGFTLKAPSPKLYYATAVTAYAPTGSVAKGFSTGRVGVDWTNRFEHTFHRLTPFFEGGLSNTVPDSAFFLAGRHQPPGRRRGISVGRAFLCRRFGLPDRSLRQPEGFQQAQRQGQRQEPV